MSRIPAVVAVVILAVGVAACGGPSAPAHSATAACRYFSTWYLRQGSNISSDKDAAALARAVHEAPSGHLYRDMSALQSEVDLAKASRGTSGASGIGLLAITASEGVAQDCQSVNPS